MEMQIPASADNSARHSAGRDLAAHRLDRADWCRFRYPQGQFQGFAC